MKGKEITFTASHVEYSKAIDWELVQVVFDSMGPTFDENNRDSPYLLLTANFEFDDKVQVEFHDGEEYDGDLLNNFELYQNRVSAMTHRGYEFHVSFELSEEAFLELREYLRVLLRRDPFQES